MLEYTKNKKHKFCEFSFASFGTFQIVHNNNVSKVALSMFLMLEDN